MQDYEKLVSILRDMDGAVIGYSGGVDSTLVSKAATDALGERAVCVLVDSCLVPRPNIDDAVALADKLGLTLVRSNLDALAIPTVSLNSPQRCNHCKEALISELTVVAKKHGISVVLDGSTAGDSTDCCNNSKTADELDIRSPLKELGLTKTRIREISRELGLVTWNQPSRACLASRVPYGIELTREILGQIEAAESILHEMGFCQCRVYHHCNVVRIELLPEDMEALLAPDARNLALHRLRAIGYKHIALDLAGYRTDAIEA